MLNRTLLAIAIGVSATTALMTGSMSDASAQSVTISYLEGSLPVAPDAVATLGPNLFGDKVNLFNGALEFEQTDTSLPGNSRLPVALSRKYVAGRSWWVRGQFGDWDLEAPRIGGTFAAGWVTTYGGLNRCTGFSLPPIVSAPGGGGGFNVMQSASSTEAPAVKEVTPNAATVVGFIASEYWQGTSISVPGIGSQEVLQRVAAYPLYPTDGRSYYLVTRNNWQIGCLPAVQNAPGEGFFAVSPEGTTYRFDWMATRTQTELKKNGAQINRNDHFLMATEVTDRFGNWVRYTYDPGSPLLLTRIESSDGRVIVITNAGGRAVTVSDGSRTFRYIYDAIGNLQSVIQPDESRWTFNLTPLTAVDMSDMGEGANCDRPGTLPSDDLVGTMTHPSGATGTFAMRYVYQGRTYVDRYCKFLRAGSPYTTGAVYPQLFGSQALLGKTVSGPGMPELRWSYSYGVNYCWNPCTGYTGGDRRIVYVTDPSGTVTAHQFGNRWRVNEGQLLEVNEGWTGSAWLRTTTHRYRTSSGQCFPEQFGASLLRNGDHLATLNRPEDLRVTSIQGATFTWQAATGCDGIDALARPRQVLKFSSLGYSRTETTRYFDHFGKWVLGQTESVTDSWGRVPQATVYSSATALPIEKYSYGRLLERFEHQPDGNLSKRIDPAGRAATFSDYARGLPRAYIHRDGSVESADITNLGRVAWHKNAAGTTTSFSYDAMGRLSQINYPGETWGSYFPTNVSFTQNPASEHGLAAGHWRQIVTMGNAITMRWYDALWRLRLEQTWDVTDGPNTSRMVEHRYDLRGNKSFQTYPARGVSPVDLPRNGTSWFYDSLGREIEKRQNSELGDLSTFTSYLNNFEKRVTDPRGQATLYRFQAYDAPSGDVIAGIVAPDSAWTTIQRDENGQPNSITRGGTYEGTAQQATRTYVYDVHRRLCKTIEPETGATVQDYDVAGNVAWRASGQPLPSTSSCEQAAVSAGSKILFGYDAEGRLKTTTHGDGTSVIARNYTPDGLLKDLTASRLGVNTITWLYEYNNRRKLLTETYAWGDPYNNWRFRHAINSHGHVAGFEDPWGYMNLAPNGLGEPTQVGSYASNVTYHPNGAVAGYQAGNGRAHSNSQNMRGMPEAWVHAGVTYDTYRYDANSNVTSITDAQEGAHRSMTWYDAHDRLRRADGPWGAALFDYDALDNLTRSTVGGRSLVHTIDPGSNRLTRISGSLDIPIGYDVNGNVNSRGGQTFNFDLGNRLISAPGKATYAYDGHGRRNLNWFADGTYRHDAYTQDGKLRLSWTLGKGGARLVYLRDKLIAETTEVGGVTTYIHTDVLGSPVAKTNGAGAVIERTRYEPYGATVAGSTDPARIGFTGHVNDRETGLVYMQQRYYDPIAGRFLSVDPVTTDAKTGRSFNRYAYVENNPYRYTDPDGRDTNPVTGESRILDRDLRTNASNPDVGKFGFTRSATNWNNGFHGGVDLKAPVGTNLKAPISGVVTATKDFEGSKEGNMVTISGSGDNKNVSVSMMHLSGMSVKSGDKISEGQVIGKSGDSGNAKGLPGAEAHVHMSVKVEGKTVDPQAHFNRQKENY